MALAMPIARPDILITEKLLLRNRFRQATLKKFFIMVNNFILFLNLSACRRLRLWPPETDRQAFPAEAEALYSERRLLTGFATAAFIAWKLTVTNAIIIAANPPVIKSHQLISMRYT